MTRTLAASLAKMAYSIREVKAPQI